jgi:hypothetical protein
MQSFNTLKQVVHIAPRGLQRVKVIKSWKTKRAVHRAILSDMRNLCKTLVRKSDGKRPFGRSLV